MPPTVIGCCSAWPTFAEKVYTPLLPEGEIEVLLIAETGEIAYRS